jgi:hypothetical protein
MVAAVGRTFFTQLMDSSNRNWLPPWPVVPPRLWLTAAGGVVAGLSVVFQREIWPHHPKAEIRSLIVLGLLVQAGGIQLIRVLMAWLRTYQGPRWAQLIMAFAVFPVCFAVALLLLGVFLLTCFWLINALTI